MIFTDNYSIHNDILVYKGKEITSGIFRSLKIKKVILEDVETINTCSFYDNEIEEIRLPETIKMIKMYAFYRNKLKKVILPSNIIEVEDYAFDNNVEIVYKNRIFDKRFFEKYTLSNLVKVSKILDIVHDLKLTNLDLYFPKEIVDVIPINNDSIKSYIVYRKKFLNSLEKIYDNEDIVKYIGPLYKMYYVFGFFNTNMQDDVTKVIKKFSKIYKLYEIQEMFKSIELDAMYPKLATLIIDNYSNPVIPQILIKYYNMFKQLMNIIIKKKKEILRKKSVEIIREKEKNIDISYLEEEYKEQLQNLKRITLSDIIEYVNDTNFSIKNKELYDVALTLSSYITSKEFEGIEDIYTESKEVVDEQYFKNISEKRLSYDKKYFAFLKNSDPVNLILGYLCDCCAKYSSEGEDILRQSMINPCIKNMIIYSGLKKIIAKSTCFYNKENQTIIFNNIEASKSFVSKSSVEEKREVILSFLRGIKEQIRVMNRNGIEVSEVRMEVSYCKLKDSLLSEGMVVSLNRLPNYPYKGFNYLKSKEGQAIIYTKKKYRN